MRDALKHFALLSLACLIILGMAGLYVRQSALSEPIKEPMSHPFLAEKTPLVIAHPGLDAKKEPGPRTFAEAAKLPNHVVIWADIHLDLSNRLVANQADGTTISLGQLLESQPTRRFVLNFTGNRPGMSDVIVGTLDDSKASDRILVQSPEDGLLKDLREERPKWIFGTSRQQTTIMTMLSSIGLEAAAPVRGDVYVAEWDKVRGKMDLPKRIVDEIHRRRLRVIAGPVDGKQAADELISKGVDGVLVSRPGELIDQATR